MKLPPFDASQRKMVAATDMGRREARFYAGPAAEVPMRIPVAHFAAAGDEPTEYVMVLEDLAASGCTFTNRLEPHEPEQSRRLVESMARVHAEFWNDPRFDDELSWVQPAMRGSFGAKLIDRAREQFSDEFPPVFTELCRLYSEHHERITELWDEGERTLIHGDTHLGNHFVDDGEVGLYDWAVLSRSPGIRDIAIYLGNSCPTEQRRAGQEDWIRAYHQALVRRGRGRAVVRRALGALPPDGALRLGGRHDDRLDGQQVATDRGRHDRHDPGHRHLRRPRHRRRAARGPLGQGQPAPGTST